MKRDVARAVPYHVKFTQVYDELTAQNEVAWEKACAELGGFKAAPEGTLPPARGSREVKAGRWAAGAEPHGSQSMIRTGLPWRRYIHGNFAAKVVRYCESWFSGAA